MNTINNSDETLEGIFQTWEERLAELGSKPTGERAEGDALWLDVADMPKAYRRHYERQEAKRKRAEERKKLWEKKPSLRSGARGRRHYASKRKTARLRKERAWAATPFECILNMNSYACKRLDRAIWDIWAAPLWEQYEPTQLYVRFPHGSGTKAEPWSMFNIRVLHKTKGLLLDGASLELYYLGASPEAGDERQVGSASMPHPAAPDMLEEQHGQELS